MNNTMLNQLRSHLWTHFDKNRKIDISGIYRIHNANGDIIYVGQSQNIHSRLLSHFTGNTHTRNFVDEMIYATYREIKEPELISFMEMSYILCFRPKYNAQINDSEEYIEEYSEFPVNEFLTSIDEFVSTLEPENVHRVKPIDLFEEYELFCDSNGKKFINKKLDLYSAIEKKFECYTKVVKIKNISVRVYYINKF